MVERDLKGAWKAAFSEVKEFVAKNDAISITPTSLSIPSDARAGFYDKVGETRRALTRAALGEEKMREIANLALRAGEVRDGIVARSDLRAFHLPQEVETLISDPIEALSKPAFGHVLDALQNEATEEEIFARVRADVLRHAGNS